MTGHHSVRVSFPLLLDSLVVDSGPSLTAQEDILQQGSVASVSPVPAGTTGWWHGPLGKKQVGVFDKEVIRPHLRNLHESLRKQSKLTDLTPIFQYTSVS